MVGRRWFVLVGVVAALVLAGCEYPMPHAGPDGSGPDVVWVDSPQPPLFGNVTLDLPQYPSTVYVLINPTAPRPQDCPEVPALYDLLCGSHFQGTGFATVVPPVCVDETERHAPGAPFGVTRLVVNDEVVPVPPSGGVRRAIYVAVAGAGQLTAGWYQQTPDGISDWRRTNPVPRVPVAERYVVKLTCVIGEDHDGGPIQMTFVGTVAPPA